MTENKQIIIDGVDVSGCEYCLKMTKYRCAIQRDVYKCLCEENPNCHYKQLAYKTQECELLKKELELVYDDCKGCPTCNEALYNANLYAKEYRKLKQTFNMIKGIAEENIRIADLEGLNGVYRRGLAEQILQKISEVENE